ncbi:rhomboid family intramembrane serine protease [Desulfogranum japonicum]|uniref:rhomboid family intramembrane serine protease n=1 Tax=Desulfogranum japonicum TaxID=231447 RepID=UPI0003FB0E8D|nr:rhomboid family intramembrane serine protease [Desulfogranum japonicum]
MFPLYDENPTSRFPIVTVAIVILCSLAWIFIQGMGREYALATSMCSLAIIPADLLGSAPAGMQVPVGHNLACVLSQGWPWYTMLSHMFLHGSWMHLVGNLWFLWVFGDNVEDAMGPLRFAVFYLLCGLVAAVVQVMSSPDSLLPMVGASGAIGGVMGAYVRLYPHARIKTLIFLGIFITVVSVPAIFMLCYWFGMQLLGIVFSHGQEGGVAFFAHFGGFAAGFLLVGVFRKSVSSYR